MRPSKSASFSTPPRASQPAPDDLQRRSMQPTAAARWARLSCRTNASTWRRLSRRRRRRRGEEAGGEGSGDVRVTASRLEPSRSNLKVQPDMKISFATTANEEAELAKFVRSRFEVERPRLIQQLLAVMTGFSISSWLCALHTAFASEHVQKFPRARRQLRCLSAWPLPLRLKWSFVADQRVQGEAAPASHLRGFGRPHEH